MQQIVRRHQHIAGKDLLFGIAYGDIPSLECRAISPAFMVSRKGLLHAAERRIVRRILKGDVNMSARGSSEDMDGFSEFKEREPGNIQENLNRKYLIPAGYDMIVYAAESHAGKILTKTHIARALGYKDLSGLTERVKTVDDGINSVSYKILRTVSQTFDVPIELFINFSDYYYNNYDKWSTDPPKALAEFKALLDERRGRRRYGSDETEYFFDDEICSPRVHVGIVADFGKRVPEVKLRGVTDIPSANAEPCATFRIGDRCRIEVEGPRDRNVILLEVRLDSHEKRDWRLVNAMSFGPTDRTGKFTFPTNFGKPSGIFRIVAVLMDKSIEVGRWKELRKGSLCPAALLQDLADQTARAEEDRTCLFAAINYELVP